ncbi:UTRA domain-containing protein, partial [Paraburkholderia sp. SIMBA_027]|uniref:UTRA domain-containing protein n=1 Tax=Paraburkholderia sp. SIMBA_027 TaxID=3085770 RepID=UPI00397AA934
ETNDFKPTHVEQTFEAVLSNNDTASKLEIPIGEPLLKVTSMVYKDEEPLEFKEAFYKGDIYKFFVTRRLHFE